MATRLKPILTTMKLVLVNCPNAKSRVALRMKWVEFQSRASLLQLQVCWVEILAICKCLERYRLSEIRARYSRMSGLFRVASHRTMVNQAVARSAQWTQIACTRSLTTIGTAMKLFVRSITTTRCNRSIQSITSKCTTWKRPGLNFHRTWVESMGISHPTWKVVHMRYQTWLSSLRKSKPTSMTRLRASRKSQRMSGIRSNLASSRRLVSTRQTRCHLLGISESRTTLINWSSRLSHQTCSKLFKGRSRSAKRDQASDWRSKALMCIRCEAVRARPQSNSWEPILIVHHSPWSQRWRFQKCASRTTWRLGWARQMQLPLIRQTTASMTKVMGKTRLDLVMRSIWRYPVCHRSKSHTLCNALFKTELHTPKISRYHLPQTCSTWPWSRWVETPMGTITQSLKIEYRQIKNSRAREPSCRLTRTQVTSRISRGGISLQVRLPRTLTWSQQACLRSVNHRMRPRMSQVWTHHVCKCNRH